MLAHEDGRVGIVEQIAGEPRKLRDHLLGNIGVPLRRNKHRSPGEPSRTETNALACEALHGCFMTRGWVVTRRNSYRMGHVVYHASGRPRWCSSQWRDLACQGESASAA